MDNKDMLFVRNGIDEDCCSDQDNIWDDTALIKAYDVAVKAVKDKIALRLECNDLEGKDQASGRKISKKTSCPKNKKLEWQIGAACRATYSEDGKIYEAIVKNINPSTNTCIITYVGYENEEEVPIAQLMVSEGPAARALQEKEALYDSSEAEIETSAFQKGLHQTKRQMNREKMQKKNNSESKFAKDYIANFGSQFPPMQHPSHFGHPYSSNTGSSYTMPASLPPPPPLSVMSSLPLGDTEALSAMLMSWYMSGFHTGYYQGLQQAKQLNGVTKQTP